MIDRRDGGWLRPGNCLPYLAPLLLFQITLPFGAAGLRLNLADPMVALAAVLIAMSLLSGRLRLTEAGKAQLAVLGVLSAVITFALIRGRFEIGEFTTWALVNKYIGWFVLIGFAATGIVVATVAGRSGVRKTLRLYVLTLGGVSAIDVGTILVNSAGITVPTLGDSLEASGLTGNSNAFALALLLGICLLVVQTGSRSAIPEPRLACGLLALFLAGLWLTGSIAGYIGAVVVLAGSAIFALPAWRRIARSLVFAAAAIAATSLFGQFAAPHFGLESAGRSSSVRAHIAGAAAMTSDSTGERIELARDAFTLWQDYPLFGAGLGTFLHRQSESGAARVQIVHSSPLWLMAEMGLVGLLPFVLAFVLLFRCLWKYASGGDDDAAVAQACVLFVCGFAVMSLFHEMVYQRLAWFFTGLALGLVVPGLRTAGSSRAAESDQHAGRQQAHQAENEKDDQVRVHPRPARRLRAR